MGMKKQPRKAAMKTMENENRLWMINQNYPKRKRDVNDISAYPRSTTRHFFRYPLPPPPSTLGHTPHQTTTHAQRRRLYRAPQRRHNDTVSTQQQRKALRQADVKRCCILRLLANRCCPFYGTYPVTYKHIDIRLWIYSYFFMDRRWLFYPP